MLHSLPGCFGLCGRLQATNAGTQGSSAKGVLELSLLLSGYALQKVRSRGQGGIDMLL